MADVEIALLGRFTVTIAGVAMPPSGWSRRHAATLVKVLALAPGHRLHREQVMDVLWPDESPSDAAPKLHKAAHFARLATGRHDTVVLRRGRPVPRCRHRDRRRGVRGTGPGRHHATRS